MITPDYIRTMAEYNAEMNRRLYGAAARLSDHERRQPRGAFWGSIHGTLTHILWETSSGCRVSTPGPGRVLRSSKVPA
jgi:uncharacterized damage-inducible protein DinB